MSTLPSEMKSKETTLNHGSILKNKQNWLYFVRFLGRLLFISEGFLPMVHHPKRPEWLKVTDVFKGCEAPRGFRILYESVKRRRVQRKVGVCVSESCCLCVWEQVWVMLPSQRGRCLNLRLAGTGDDTQ